MTVVCPLCKATFTRNRDLSRHTANRCPLRNSHGKQIIIESKTNITSTINKKITVKLKNKQNLSPIKLNETSIIPIPEAVDQKIAPESELTKLTDVVMKMMEELKKLEKMTMIMVYVISKINKKTWFMRKLSVNNT